MQKSDRVILKNASFMMLSQSFTWVLALVLTLFLPRYLGTTGIGQIHLASSIWAIVGVVAAFGMDALMIKEIARAPERTSELFTNSAVIRSLFFLVGSIVVFLYARLVQYPGLTIWVIMIIGVSNFFAYLGAACHSSLQGLERMEFSAIANMIERTVATVVTIVLLVLGYGVIPVAIVMIGGSIIGFLVQFTALNRLRRITLSFNLGLIRWLLAASVPYLFISGFIIIYGQIDSIVISLLINERGVGLYSVTDRLVGTFLFVPTIFISAIFPALSRMFVGESASFTRLTRKSFDLMMLIAVPVGLGVFLIANPLVVLLFGADFADSGPILALRGIVTIFSYLNMLVGLLLISVDRQKAWTIVLGAATVASIFLDWIFVPWAQQTFNNGAMGGAFSYLITETLMTVAGLVLLPKGLLGLGNVRYSGKVLAAGLLMVAVTWWSRNLMIAFPILIGALSYVCFLILLRVLTREDWQLLAQLGGSLIHRALGRKKAAAASAVQEG